MYNTIINFILSLFTGSKSTITKYVVIALSVVLLGYLGYKSLFKLGIFETTEEKLAKEKVLRETYEKHNKELIKKVQEVETVKDISLGMFKQLTDENEKIEEEKKEVKTKLEEKLKRTEVKVKKIIKTKPVTNNVIKVNRLELEKGKVMIDAIWSVYEHVEDKK